MPICGTGRTRGRAIKGLWVLFLTRGAWEHAEKMPVGSTVAESSTDIQVQEGTRALLADPCVPCSAWGRSPPCPVLHEESTGKACRRGRQWQVQGWSEDAVTPAAVLRGGATARRAPAEGAHAGRPGGVPG